MAASSPATTTSVVCGRCENRAATKNGRALFATPSVPSPAASNLPQNSSKHPERSNANRKLSMSMQFLPQTHMRPASSFLADAKSREGHSIAATMFASMYHAPPGHNASLEEAHAKYNICSCFKSNRNVPPRARSHLRHSAKLHNPPSASAAPCHCPWRCLSTRE